ncbi:MAG: putative 4-hydroxybenzoate polyprenyltransferase [Armatimonadetes bacterium]|nr:putative 4-hydroxybenzoate polyprenyltransferase [Armatimonadota bacterium]
MSVGVIRRAVIVLEMIKFEHTVFALPFALSSALVAAAGLPDWRTLGWILVAMVGARSAAMAFNRIADSQLDALNPRTADRAIPRGLVSHATAWVIVLAGSAILILSAYMLNPLAFALSPVALLAVVGYSYSKRFTSLSHVWLGLCLGIAPIGAWIAVRGEIDLPPIVLSAAVALWTAGFDIIYSLQDIDFDRKIGLFSLPARIGAGWSLVVSRLFHVAAVTLLVWFGIMCAMGTLYYVGVALAALCLFYEQSIVSADDISRVNSAFFTANGLVSMAMLVFVATDVLI